MVIAYEGFSVSNVAAGNFPFHGLRRVQLHGNNLVVECGYLSSGLPPTGATVVTVPSKDTLGEAGRLTTTVDILRWDLSFDTGGYRTGNMFTYTGVIDDAAGAQIEFEYADKPDTRFTVVAL